MAEVYRPKATEELEPGPTVQPIQSKRARPSPQKNINTKAKNHYKKTLARLKRS